MLFVRGEGPPYVHKSTLHEVEALRGVFDAIAAVAKSQKDRSCSDRAKELSKAFKDWLSKALTGGAGQAFALLRSPPTQLLCPVTDADGRPSRDPEHVLSHKLAAWAPLWQEQTPERRCAVAGLAQRLRNSAKLQSPRRLNGRLLQLSLKGYSKSKSTGADLWTVTELRELPLEVLEIFAEALNDCQDVGTWAAQLLFNLMTGIGKPGGGERFIGKTPMIYRAWSRARRPEILQWSSEHTSELDKAVAGCSAFKAAAARAYSMEVAVATGKEAAAVLWDVWKFFDTVPLDGLLEGADEAKYPVTELALGVQMHLAPRALQIAGACSTAVAVSRSLLPGCLQAMPFAKAFMLKDMEGVAERHPGVELAMYVDDAGQHATGSRFAVVRKVAGAALDFAHSVVKLRLELSGSKSVVVSSSRVVAHGIAARLSAAGVEVKVAHASRDLGLLLNPGHRRRTTLLRARLVKAKGKMLRIAGLAQLSRGARRLAVAGGLAVGTWGQAALGMAPTQTDRLRSDLAAAAGISASPRCRTTTIALAYGDRCDPEVKLVSDTIGMWLDLWQELPALRADARAAWRFTYRKIFDEASGRVRWQAVTGPIAATIATLCSRGWRTSTPELWTDPSGQQWAMGGGRARKKDILEVVIDVTVAAHWRHASLGWQGVGLELGIDEKASFGWLRKLRKAGRGAEAALLETLLVGACWSGARIVARGGPSTECSLCGELDVDDMHTYWDCPGLVGRSDPELVDSEYLVSHARAGAKDFPCWWLRGLCPVAALKQRTPPPREAAVVQVGPSRFLGEWDGGRLWSDASAGEYGRWPRLRRCGCGLARIRSSLDLTYELVWGAHFALPGDKQTVPRAELYAMVVAVENTNPCHELHIFSDSKINVDLYDKGTGGCLNAENSDLWDRMWRAIAGRTAVLRISWVKAHCTIEQLSRGETTEEHFVGNAVADALAAVAAHAAQVPFAEAEAYLWAVHVTKRLQQRHIKILTLQGKRPKAVPKASRLQEPDAFASAVLRSNHVIQLSEAGQHWCERCKESCPDVRTKALTWLATDCSVSSNWNACSGSLEVRWVCRGSCGPLS